MKKSGSTNIRTINCAIISIVLLVSCSKNSTDKPEDTPLPYSEATVKIAKWKDNKAAVVSLLFDDSTPGQALLGIPALINRNITGTWYVNPGRDSFIKYIDTWKNAAGNGQEIANHTMTHTGASTYEETVYEIGEASKIIWEIRNEEEYGSLISFNRGGGTTWNEDDLANILNDFKNVDRLAYTGVRILANPITPGSDAEQMFSLIPEAIKDSIIGRVHFHGIAAENGTPPMDYGNGAVWIKEFETFVDKLITIKDDVWFGGCIAVYKYILERETATVNIVQFNDGHFSVNLTSDMDEKYYDEQLTILVYLPDDWYSCMIKYKDFEKSYAVENGLLMFDVVPNQGEISLTKD
jgi:hypothetical protein